MQGYIAVGCACTSLVISIISIALPYWYYYQPSLDPLSSGIHYGLWTFCIESTVYLKSESTCESFEIAPEFLGAVRMLEIIGLLFEAGAAVLGALKWSKENEAIQRLAGGQAIIAGVLMISGTIVFAINTLGLVGPLAKLRAASSINFVSGTNLHAGFALAIVSGVIALFSGFLFFCSKSVKKIIQMENAT